jgi:hypothetical protein
MIEACGAGALSWHHILFVWTIPKEKTILRHLIWSTLNPLFT